MSTVTDHQYVSDPDLYRVARRRRARRAGRIADLAALTGGFLAVFLVAAIVFGALGGLSGSSSANSSSPRSSASADEPAASIDPDTHLEAFSESVFADVQGAWQKMFESQGSQYQPAQLVLYSGGVNTACGSASSAVGPFYCPSDETVYIDPSFYRAMRDQLGAPGDFAWAYVIAHELGHHIQTLTGTTQKVAQAESDGSADANDLSVRLELQADCYAGVWSQTAYKEGRLETGDLDEGLTAAASVGDDRMKGRSGSIDPDSFSHGTSQQRVSWFKQGFDSGKPESCDTFSSASL